MSRFIKFDKQKNSRDVSSNNYLVNAKIKDENLLVIDQTGNNLGVISKIEALRLAEDAGLDLVQVGKKDSYPIAKIMDFGKFLYVKKKQMLMAKKKQKVIKIKEIKMRPNIGDQDYNTKLKKAIEFLTSGKKVKFTLQFKGREFIMIKDLGTKFFERLYTDLNSKDLGTLVQEKEQRGGPFWSKIYYLK